MFKRYVHYDKDIEMTIIGSFLIEKSAFSRTVGLLTEDCFYCEENKFLFTIIQSMWKESHPIDFHTVTDRIVKKDYAALERFGLPYYLCECTKSVTSTANLEVHSLIVRQMYVEREMVKIQTSISAEGDVVDRVKGLQNELFKLMTIKVSNDWHDMIDVVLELHKHMDEVKDKELIGLPTGFTKLDLITGGLAKTNMIVLAARPSVGKSALLNAMALHQATLGHRVGIISLEMPNIQIGARFGSLISDTEFYKIFRNRMDDEKQREQVYHNLEKLANVPIKISDKTGVDIHDIKAKAAQLINKKELDILYIDYLQLVDGASEKNYNREQEVSKLSRGIKLMAMEFDIPVVVLAQLNREAEKTSTKKPQLHHLRESGAIEQDADGVIFLHRDFKVGIETDKDGRSTEHEADLIVAKWRNGETPEIKIGFNAPKMKFYDLDKPITHTPARTWQPYKEDN